MGLCLKFPICDVNDNDNDNVIDVDCDKDISNLCNNDVSDNIVLILMMIWSCQIYLLSKMLVMMALLMLMITWICHDAVSSDLNLQCLNYFDVEMQCIFGKDDAFCDIVNEELKDSELVMNKSLVQDLIIRDL